MTDDQECTCVLGMKAGLVGEASRGSGRGRGLFNVLLGLY